jgi:hypothetical protein
MKVVEHQAWRRPILAHAEETYDLVAGEPKRAIMWYIHGEHQEEDQKRLAQGLACGDCLSVFPARPAMENLRDWRPISHEWNTIRTPSEVLALVAQGRCPTCGSEVSPEMHNVMHRGLDPFRPRGMDS